MTNVPEPADPVLRLEMRRDQLLVGLWAEFCEHHASQGSDPNKPPRYTRSFRDFANHRVDPFIKEAGMVQYAGWKTVGPSEVGIRAEERRDVAGRVSRWWGEALNLLDQLLSVSEEFSVFHVQRLQAGQERFPRTYPLLIHLHSRGVQVAEETLALLRSGFAAGAEARWRTLHETAVVAAFIAKHGIETVDRYADHDNVRVKKAMDSEQEHHRELGLEPYTDEEMREAANKVAELKQKYGSAYLGDYGWAAHALGRKPDGKPPTFLDIEASLNLRVAAPLFSDDGELSFRVGAIGCSPTRRWSWLESESKAAIPARSAADARYGRTGAAGATRACTVGTAERALVQRWERRCTDCARRRRRSHGRS